MGTCKTCRWWLRFECRVVDDYDPGMTNEAIRGVCQRTVYEWSRDGGGIRTTSVLVTGPDFGCIHHEPVNNAGEIA